MAGETEEKIMAGTTGENPTGNGARQGATLALLNTSGLVCTSFSPRFGDSILIIA